MLCEFSTFLVNKPNAGGSFGFAMGQLGIAGFTLQNASEDWSTEGSEFGGVDLEIDETFGRGPRGQLSSR